MNKNAACTTISYRKKAKTRSERCAGEVTVFVQAYFSPPQLVIVGGGHIGRPLKVMGEAAGFDVMVVDVTLGHETVPGLENS